MKIDKLHVDILKKKGLLFHFMTSLDLSSPQDLHKIKLSDTQELIRNNEIEDVHTFHVEVAQTALKWLFKTLHSYRINKQFLDVLDTKANIVLSADYLIHKLNTILGLLNGSSQTGGLVFCIEFPYEHRQSVSADTKYIKTILITFYKGFLTFFMPYYSSDTHRLGIKTTLSGINPSGELFAVNLESTKNKHKSLEHVICNNFTQHEFMIKVIKVLLYIVSDGQPDLRNQEPFILNTSKPKKRRRQIIEEEIFPTTVVGFNFCKDPMYTKKEWDYLRWQPYGSRNDPKYKLIHVFARRRKHLAGERGNDSDKYIDGSNHESELIISCEEEKE